MKLFITILLGLFVWLPEAGAQMFVEVKLEQEQFLPGETLPVVVRVTNRSGQSVKLGDEPDWLTFSVESRDSFVVSKNGEVPVLETFSLDTAKVATKRVDLAPYFALTRSGRYRVVATVRIKGWGAQIASSPKDFDIIEGAQLWTREFGVPASAGSNQPPELRRYTLLEANYLRSGLRLYFRLSDVAGARIFRVFPLGQMISFGRPEAEVDGHSQLHVLHQNGARTSLYTVINPAGDAVTRQLYDFLEARPRLQPDRAGNISVTGGVRRPTQIDLPAERVAEFEPSPAKP